MPTPYPGWYLEIEPRRIAQVLSASHCDLLLDTGHARIAAEELGLAAKEYVAALPLERVAQIHVNGPRQVMVCWHIDYRRPPTYRFALLCRTR